jgi:hypothetical protein
VQKTAKAEVLTYLEHRCVDNVHKQHGLEQGVCELRLGLEQLPCLVGLRFDQGLRISG